MVLIPDNVLGAWLGDDTSEVATLTPGQLLGFPLGVLMLGGNDTVFGSTDGEVINGNQDEDQIAGAGGSDTLFGGRDNDTLDGQADADFLFGNLGADLLRAGNGDDRLFGGQNGDNLFGDLGNDVLSGDDGIDFLTGGEGADIFVLPQSGLSTDFITDFTDGTDRMLLPDGLGFSSLQILPRGSTQTVIAVGTEELAVLNGVQPTQITAEDFDTATITPTPPTPPTNGGSGTGAAGLTVNLDQGFIFTPTITDTIQIMPLGDSITQGQVNNDTPEAEREGYRLGLQERLEDFGLNFDFVGSNSNGTSNLPDQDHEGNPGFTIVNVDRGRNTVPNSGVDNWIPTFDPDVILLMIGTNSAGREVEQMTSQMNNLLDSIINDNGFTGDLIVSTIPPIRSDGRFEERVPNAEAFNAQLPGLVDQFAQAGANITFVDMINVPNGLTVDDITAPPDDSGIHPTVEGYDKIAQFWFNALLPELGSVAAVSNPYGALGTDGNDVLIGNGNGNALQGEAGNDSLTGGAGGDGFIFTFPNQGQDTITDFNPAEGDAILISAAGFGGGLVAGTPLSTEASATGTFVSEPLPAPVGSSANILYSSASGLLSFDPDGTGPQPSTPLAILEGSPQLTANQIGIN
ncbi:MAG: GDSL-type esterase/lipase family protein [Microcoleaceae cyanobacterium]